MQQQGSTRGNPGRARKSPRTQRLEGTLESNRDRSGAGGVGLGSIRKGCPDAGMESWLRATSRMACGTRILVRPKSKARRSEESLGAGAPPEQEGAFVSPVQDSGGFRRLRRLPGPRVHGARADSPDLVSTGSSHVTGRLAHDRQNHPHGRKEPARAPVSGRADCGSSRSRAPMISRFVSVGTIRFRWRQSF